MMTRFAKSQEVAEAIAVQSARTIAESVDTSGFDADCALPFVVFNTSGHRRSNVIVTRMDVERRYFDHQPPHEKYQEFKREYEAFDSNDWVVLNSEGKKMEAVITPVGPTFGYDLPDDRFRQPYWAYQVDVELHVQNIPGFGYHTFALVPKRVSGENALSELTATELVTEEQVMENDYVRIEIAGMDRLPCWIK